MTAFSAQNLSIFWVYKAFFTRYNIQRVENMQGAPLRPGTVPVMSPGTGLRTMGIEFNRIITLLRKERGITQKQAAQDLGISQAQLSHYEKGIRECGLAFVVQVADYYDVSCDYLLGRSAERSGQTITVEELPEGNSATGGSVYRGSVLPTMYKKLIENSLDILYDKLQESRDKQLVVGVSSYLMLAVYKMFRLLYEASPKNVSGMFRVGSARWDRSADAAMSMAEGDLAAALTGEHRPARPRLPPPRHQPFQPRQKCRGSHARAEKGGVKPKIRACAVRLHRLFLYKRGYNRESGPYLPSALRQAGQTYLPWSSTASGEMSPQKTQLPCAWYLRIMMESPSVKISSGVSGVMS